MPETNEKDSVLISPFVYLACFVGVLSPKGRGSCVRLRRRDRNSDSLFHHRDFRFYGVRNEALLMRLVMHLIEILGARLFVA